MCGIVGVVSTKTGPSDLELIAMRDTLAHRGPDDQGLWVDRSSVFVGFGHRRLSVIDVTPSGHQPMSTPDGRVTITFNGEIYNYLELKKELLNSGRKFVTKTDTEVILQSYLEWGESFVEHLRGMFAFGLWDGKERLLILARDRMGEKPLYYHSYDGEFVFASELKAIVAFPGFRKEVDITAVADYACFGYVPDPKAIWKNCSKLEAGTILLYRPLENKTRLRQYWDIDFTPHHGVKAGEWSERLLAALDDAVKSQMMSDVPLGAFLSGGVDSGSVVAAMTRASSKVTTVSIGLEDRSLSELPNARLVAERYHTDHHEKVLSPTDIGEVFDRMVWHFDEPFNDFSYFPTYYVSREARKIVTVALSGDGGDELLAGYPKYARLLWFNRAAAIVPQALRRLIATAGRSTIPRRILHDRNLSRLQFSPEEVLKDAMSMVHSPSELPCILHPDHVKELHGYNPLHHVERYLTRDPVKSWDIVGKARYLDVKMGLAGDMLVKVDRASMANSLEVRPPLLDHRFVELVEKIPTKHLLSVRLGGKAILKKAMAMRVPRENLMKAKTGFGFPLGEWLRKDLRKTVDSLLPNSLQLYDATYVKKILSEHMAGSHNHQYRIHSFLFVEHWARKWSQD